MILALPEDPKLHLPPKGLAKRAALSAIMALIAEAAKEEPKPKPLFVPKAVEPRITVRSCLDCGLDVPGGPTRCTECAAMDPRLRRVAHVLRRDFWQTRWSASGRRRALVAALYGARLAQCPPEQVIQVHHDWARMQWTVDVDDGVSDAPIVLVIGDEAVDAWAGREGLLQREGS